MLRLIAKGTLPVFLISISDTPTLPNATSIEDVSDNSKVAISFTISRVPLLNKVFSSEVVLIVIVFISSFCEESGTIVLIIIVELLPGRIVIERESTTLTGTLPLLS